MILAQRFKKYSSVFGGMLLLATISASTITSSSTPYLFSYIRINDNSDIRYSQTLWITSLLVVSVSLSANSNGILINQFKLNIILVVLVGSMFLSLFIHL